SQALYAVVLPEPSHSTVWLAATVPMTGPVVSSILKVAEVLVVLLQASLAVKMIRICLLLPQSATQVAVPLSSLQVTAPPQPSVADPRPSLQSKALYAVVLPKPSHSTVWLAATVPMAGP